MTFFFHKFHKDTGIVRNKVNITYFSHKFHKDIGNVRNKVNITYILINSIKTQESLETKLI